MLTMTRTSSSTSDNQVVDSVERLPRKLFQLFSTDEGPQGWIVGSELLEDSYYITTNIRSDCPSGIVGAFDSDNVSHDPEFSIECHRCSELSRS